MKNREDFDQLASLNTSAQWSCSLTFVKLFDKIFSILKTTDDEFKLTLLVFVNISNLTSLINLVVTIHCAKNYVSSSAEA